MKKILLILLITTFLFLVGGQSICFASEILVLDNVATIGAPDVYVTDGGPGDINPALGVITFSGAIGQFIVNVTTGISKPVYPASDSHIQLVSIDVNSVGAGALNIYFGDTGFFSPLGGDFFGGGVSAPGSTVTLEAFFDNSNADLINGIPVLPGTAVSLGTLGPFGPGAFDGTMGIGGASDNEYSLFLAANVNFTAPGVTSFSEVLVGVPEPISLILLGSGLAGAGLYRRLRKPKKS